MMITEGMAQALLVSQGGWGRPMEFKPGVDQAEIVIQRHCHTIAMEVKDTITGMKTRTYTGSGHGSSG